MVLEFAYPLEPWTLASAGVLLTRHLSRHLFDAPSMAASPPVGPLLGGELVGGRIARHERLAPPRDLEALREPAVSTRQLHGRGGTPLRMCKKRPDLRGTGARTDALKNESSS